MWLKTHGSSVTGNGEPEHLLRPCTTFRLCLHSVTDSTSDFGSASEGSNPSGGTSMAEIRLFTSSSREREGRVDVTAHLEPEGDGTKEKVITQTRVDGFILPPGTYMKISAAEFDSAQEARILNLIKGITDPLEQRIRDLENRENI